MAVAGCGSGKSSSSTSQVDFKTGFAASQKAFAVLVTDIAKDITGAGSKTDAQLAKEFRGLATRADQQASQLAALTAPAKYTKRMTNDGRRLPRDEERPVHDLHRGHPARRAQGAETATRALLADAAKIKTADTSVSKDLGLPRAHATSSASSTST